MEATLIYVTTLDDFTAGLEMIRYIRIVHRVRLYRYIVGANRLQNLITTPSKMLNLALRVNLPRDQRKQVAL